MRDALPDARGILIIIFHIITNLAVVSAAIDEIRQQLPFALLGLDSDNGSEFINDNLFRYCHKYHIIFTRSRPYHKNDQAHVEQKKGVDKGWAQMNWQTWDG
jgi:hypothetical protein